MGFILIGALLAFLIAVFGIRVEDKKRFGHPDAYGPAVVVAALAGIFASLVISTGGYSPAREIERIDLKPIKTEESSENESSEIYVCVSSGNSYTFYSKPEENSATYVPMTITEKSVQIVEEPNCLEPRLIRYSEDGVATFWSFGVLGGKLYYVFYVPEGAAIYK